MTSKRPQGEAVAAPVLVGMRGTGKTTVATALAQRLGLSACDADRELERVVGKTIPEIFAGEGEPWFREQECALLLRLLDDRETILATGGGAILHQPVRVVLRDRPTVWLRAPIAVLTARICGTDRPRLMAEANDMAAELTQVLAQRETLYTEVAGHIVDTDGQSVDQVVDAIARYWQDLDRE